MSTPLQLLNLDQANEWLHKHDLPEVKVLRQEISASNWRLLPLTKQSGVPIAGSMAANLCKSAESSVLVVITERDIWPSSESTELFEKYRAFYAGDAPVSEGDSHLVGKLFPEVLEALLALCLYFSVGFFAMDDRDRVRIETNHEDQIWVQGDSKYVENFESFLDLHDQTKTTTS